MHSVSLSSSLSFAKSQINQSNFINVVARSRNYPSSLSLTVGVPLSPPKMDSHSSLQVECKRHVACPLYPSLNVTCDSVVLPICEVKICNKIFYIWCLYLRELADTGFVSVQNFVKFGLY